MTVIIDGKNCANKVLKEIEQRVKSLDSKPSLAVIMVGDNPSSAIYVRNKERVALKLGFQIEIHKLPTNTSSKDLSDLIIRLNNDDNVDGILLQLPLPCHLRALDFIELIDPKKDVDGFHPVNCGKLLINSNPSAVACTPKGIVRLLKEYDVTIEGKKAVIIGRSNIVGKPLCALLINENATVTMAHSKTKNLAQIASSADILICAIGSAKFIKKEFVKKDAIVIDVGITNVDNQISGDVDFEDVKDQASMITPVPGGVGPMTIASLMENTLELHLKNAKL